MPSINIERDHQLSLADAKAKVEEVAAKMAAKFQMETEWKKNVLTFTRSGVNGTIKISGDKINVDAELGFMLGFLKGTIEKEVHAYLDKALV